MTIWVMVSRVGQSACSVDSDKTNMDPCNYNLISEESEVDYGLEYDSDGYMCDIDSDCATDYEGASLGECGLSSCEYGPSVSVEHVQQPSHMFRCQKTDCSWIVCRKCHQNGGHKRHKRYMKLLEFSQIDV